MIFAKARGGSMYPLLKDMEIIIIDNNRKAKIGDIITFYENDILTTHRLIKIHPKILTKGDNYPFYDSNSISQKNILGVVTHVYKKNENKFIDTTNKKMINKFLFYARLEIQLIRLSSHITKKNLSFCIKRILHPLYYGYIAKKYHKINQQTIP
jgi:signal peptidase I